MTSDPVVCSICLDKLQERGRINSCEHNFHYKCIRKWSHLSNKCPTCRYSFTEIKHYKEEDIVKTVKVSESLFRDDEESSGYSQEYVNFCFICGSESVDSMIVCEGFFGCENIAHADCLTRDESLFWICDECEIDESEDEVEVSSEIERKQVINIESDDVIEVSSESEVIDVDEDIRICKSPGINELPFKRKEPY